MTPIFIECIDHLALKGYPDNGTFFLHQGASTLETTYHHSHPQSRTHLNKLPTLNPLSQDKMFPNHFGGYRGGPYWTPNNLSLAYRRAGGTYSPLAFETLYNNAHNRQAANEGGWWGLHSNEWRMDQDDINRLGNAQASQWLGGQANAFNRMMDRRF